MAWFQKDYERTEEIRMTAIPLADPASPWPGDTRAPDQAAGVYVVMEIEGGGLATAILTVETAQAWVERLIAAVGRAVGSREAVLHLSSCPCTDADSDRRPGSARDLEAIRERTDIVDLISTHVQLRKTGRRLSGLCPFCPQDIPSLFQVDPETGLWYCSACKTGGDVFRFVELIEKVPFDKAVAILAGRMDPEGRSISKTLLDEVRDIDVDELLDDMVEGGFLAAEERHSKWARKGVASALADLVSQGDRELWREVMPEDNTEIRCIYTTTLTRSELAKAVGEV